MNVIGVLTSAVIVKPLILHVLYCVASRITKSSKSRHVTQEGI
jgi:hypothetical protein